MNALLSRTADNCRWRRSAVVGATLAALMLVLSWPILQGRTFSLVPYGQRFLYPWAAYPGIRAPASAQSDQMESSYPWSVFTHNAWTSGSWPLWDPHGYAGGAPFASNGMGGLYPIRVLVNTVFFGGLAHDIFVLVHVALAFLGAYWLGRRLGLRLMGALVCALVWATNTNVWAVIQLEMVTPFFAWLPISLAAVDLGIRERRKRGLVIGALCLSQAILSGNILYSLVIALTVTAYAACLILAPIARRNRKWALVRRRAFQAAVIAVGSALFGAYVLLPTAFNLLSASRLPFTYEQIDFMTLPLDDLLRRLVTPPDHLPTAAEVFGQAYLSAPVLLLAAIGFFLTRSRAATFGRALFVTAVLVVIGGPVTYLAYHLVPSLTSVVPQRLLPVAILGACALAGAGTDRLAELAGRSRGRHGDARRKWSPCATRSVHVVVVVAVLLAIGLLGVAGTRSVNATPVDSSSHPEFPETPAITAVLAQHSTTGWPLRIIQTQSTRANPKLPPSATSLIGDTPLVFGIDSWGGYDSSTPRRTAQLLNLASGVGAVAFPQTHPQYPSGKVNWDLVSRMGADMVFAPPAAGRALPDVWGTLDARRLQPIYAGPDARVYRLSGSSAQPYLAASLDVAASDQQTLEALAAQGKNGIKVPVITGTDADALNAHELGGSGMVTAAWKGIDYAWVSVRTTGRQVLVLPVSYDEDWSATVGGHPAAITRVDYNYMAVEVPAGESRVAIHYAPRGWRLGWALSSATCALSAILCAARVVHRRRGRLPAVPAGEAAGSREDLVRAG